MPDFFINDKPEDLSPLETYKFLMEGSVAGEYFKVPKSALTLFNGAYTVKERTTSFTPDIGSDNNYYIYNSATNGNVTIDSDSIAQIGGFMLFNNKNIGLLTVLEGVGVTINENTTGNNVAIGQGDNFAIIKIGTNEYNFI